MKAYDVLDVANGDFCPLPLYAYALYLAPAVVDLMTVADGREKLSTP